MLTQYRGRICFSNASKYLDDMTTVASSFANSRPGRVHIHIDPAMKPLPWHSKMRGVSETGVVVDRQVFTFDSWPEAKETVL